MEGVSWDERKSGWWLASNGRWYAPQHYPGGWSTTALPPAPEHRGRQSAAAMITSRAKRMRDLGASLSESVTDALNDADETGPPPPGEPRTAAHAPASSEWTVARRPPSGGSATATATVTSQSTYASRLSTGQPPPPALETADDDDLPPPPGRIQPPDVEGER